MHRKVRFPSLLFVLVAVVVFFGKPSLAVAQEGPTYFGMLDVLFQILEVHSVNDGIHVAFDVKEANGPEDLGYTEVFISLDPVVDLELGFAISTSLAVLGADDGWSWGPSSPYMLTSLYLEHLPGNVLTLSDIELVAERYGFEVTYNLDGEVPVDVETTDWMPPMKKAWFAEFNLHPSKWPAVETFTLVDLADKLADRGFTLGNVPLETHTGNQVVPFSSESVEGVTANAGPTPVSHSGGMVPTQESGPTVLKIGLIAALVVVLGCAGALVFLPKGNGQMRQSHS